MHGTFSKLDHDFSVDLATYYVLKPGQYTVVPALREQWTGKPIQRTLDPNQKGGLTVVVENPS
jgi:hypothetical protein